MRIYMQLIMWCLWPGATPHTSMQLKHYMQASQEDALGALLQQRLLSFLTRGSYVEALGIIRRRAVPGYHLSFLVMASHCQTYAPHGLVEAICGFLEGLPAAFGFRLSVTSQGRSVGAEYLRGFLPRQRRQQAA